MTREEILSKYPLLNHLTKKGVNLRKAGKQFTTESCPITRHKKNHLCVNVDPWKQVWFCNDCGKGGSVIDWEMKATGNSAAEVMEQLGGSNEPQTPVKTDKVVATYQYTDENGNLKYEVVRYEPKTFLQRHEVKGEWIWNLDGVTRVPFNLPRLVDAKEVIICEGEKDTLIADQLGLGVATCCSGGSNGWLDAYGDYFKGKDVVIIQHNDVAGDKYADAVQQSVTDHANSVKRVKFPDFNDLAEFVGDEILGIDCEAAKKLKAIFDRTPHSLEPVPLYTITEMEDYYRNAIRHHAERTFTFNKFLPSLEQAVSKLVPGELCLIIADTGQGKTALLQSIARAAAPLPTLFFELELPLEMMFERFCQMEMGCFARDVENEYRNNNDSYVQNMKGLHHILTCPEAGLTADQIEGYIRRSELKFGKPAVVTCIDYVGLMRKFGARSRYESVSDHAEQLKIIAKRTGTVSFVASQIARPGDKKQGRDIRLHEAKDSGSLENSAGLVLGCWIPEPGKMTIKVLKNTKGPSGMEIDCNFDGSRMKISEEENVTT